jgi:hypothetical protein
VIIRPAAGCAFSVDLSGGEAINGAAACHNIEARHADVLAVRRVGYGDDGLRDKHLKIART